MKKLALALVCLVSVAFFASCDQIQNPSPTISILNEENCIQDGAILNLDETYPFGFKVASSAESGVELSQLVITIDDEGWDTVDLTGKTEYIYRGQITYSTQQRDSIVGQGNIKAVVTDAKDYTGTATINYSINDPAKPLIATPFEWYRLGRDTVYFEEVGLKWVKNRAETHAQIKPMDGVQLFIYDNPDVWESTTTDVEKAQLKLDAIEHMTAQTVYNNVSTSVAGPYNDVIATLTTDGEYHLIHVTQCIIGAFQSAGYPITIKGETK